MAAAKQHDQILDWLSSRSLIMLWISQNLLNWFVEPAAYHVGHSPSLYAELVKKHILHACIQDIKSPCWSLSLAELSVHFTWLANALPHCDTSLSSEYWPCAKKGVNSKNMACLHNWTVFLRFLQYGAFFRMCVNSNVRECEPSGAYWYVMHHQY